MKRVISALLIVIMCVSFTSCGKSIEGKDDVEKLRNDYQNYDSAHLTITDSNTNKVIQDFTFKYEGDILIYSYSNELNDPPFYEYNDGNECYIEQNGEVKKYKKGEFTRYTKKEPHQNATKDILFYIPQYIESSKTINNANGMVNYVYDYNVDKFNDSIKKLPDGGILESFVTTYNFSGDFFEESKLLSLSEISTYKYDDKKIRSRYVIKIDSINQITEIENKLSDKI